jgi:Transposase IS4
MCILTNVKLQQAQLQELMKAELLMFFGLLIITKDKFNKFSDLWSETHARKYECAVALGRQTHMSRKRFDNIWLNVRFYMQPDNKPDNITRDK